MPVHREKWENTKARADEKKPRERGKKGEGCHPLDELLSFSLNNINFSLSVLANCSRETILKPNSYNKKITNESYIVCESQEKWKWEQSRSKQTPIWRRIQKKGGKCWVKKKNVRKSCPEKEVNFYLEGIRRCKRIWNKFSIAQQSIVGMNFNTSNTMLQCSTGKLKKKSRYLSTRVESTRYLYPCISYSIFSTIFPLSIIILNYFENLDYKN